MLDTFRKVLTNKCVRFVTLKSILQLKRLHISKVNNNGKQVKQREEGLRGYSSKAMGKECYE